MGDQLILYRTWQAYKANRSIVFFEWSPSQGAYYGAGAAEDLQPVLAEARLAGYDIVFITTAAGHRYPLDRGDYSTLTNTQDTWMSI